MTQVTLEHVQAKQAELATLIEQLTKQAPSPVTTIFYPEVAIELQPGEHYAGPVLTVNGTLMHHLVLLAARPDTDLNWTAAKAWAEKVGGSLPDRQEQALLFANCKAALPQRWCWSSEANGSSYAWLCYFGDGNQSSSSPSYEGCAVAVRLIPLTS